MSEGRRSNEVGVMEAKNKNQYLRKSAKRCATCDQEYLYVKRDQEGTVDLECPRCDNIMTVPKGYDTVP